MTGVSIPPKIAGTSLHTHKCGFIGTRRTVGDHGVSQYVGVRRGLVSDLGLC